MNRIFKIRELGIAVSLISAVIIFSLISDGFFSLYTFSSILSASSELGLVAVGVTILMIAGEFDLSVGVNFALSGMIFAYLSSNSSLASPVILIIVLLIACFIGLVNGILSIFFSIPSFITTLGTMMFWRGILLLLTGGLPISIFNKNIAISLLNPNGDYAFISGTFIWILATVSMVFILNKTKFGNHIMATGADRNASFAMGININRVKLISFILCGFFSGMGGILQNCHIMSVLPQAGEGYELSAIAATVIGGTLLTGGIGTVFGTVFGVLLINIINSGIIQSGASTYWYQAIVGLIIILAVVINISISNKLKNFKD